MSVSKETKAYVIILLQQAISVMRKNQFEVAEDYLRSAKGELHDANMNIPKPIRIGSGWDWH